MALWLWSVAWAGKLVLGAGTVVVVTDVAGSDPSATDRGALLGEICAVGSPQLESTGDGWWQGELRCATGVTYRVTAVAVAVPGTQGLPAALSAEALAGRLGKTVKFPVPVTAPGASGSGALPPPPPPPTASPSIAPADALTRAARAGEAVRIVALSPEDAFYGNAAQVVGRTCYASQPLLYHGEGWQGGPMSCWDGEDFVFFKVALAPDPTHTDLELPPRPSRFPVPPPPVAEPDPDAAPTEVVTWADGARVRIEDISSDDGNFGDRGALVGKKCTVKGGLSAVGGTDWWTGGLSCGPRYLYFYKVRVAAPRP